jgi:hypothetical protein
MIGIGLHSTGIILLSRATFNSFALRRRQPSSALDKVVATVWLTNDRYGRMLSSMAIPKIKATYSLDAETVRLLERISRRWGVSKSEVLRRAIRASAATTDEDAATVALDRLQRAVDLTESVAAAWARRARAERRAAGKPGR